MTPEIFITDLDGTLLRDDKSLSIKDINALKSLGARGVVRVVATGRSWYSFMQAVKKMGFSKSGDTLPVDYVIFSTGAGIMAFPSMNLIRHHSLTSHEVHGITAYFESQKLDYMVHEPIPNTRNFVFRSHGGDNPDFRSRVEIYSNWAVPMKKGGINGFGSATQVLAIVPQKKAYGVFERTTKALSGLSVIRATSPLDHESVWIEVFPENVSKSNGAAWLAKRLGIGQENVVAVGNDYNDTDLLLWAGKGFVVDNAPLDLKSQFTTVASNNCSGVAAAIGS